MVTQRALYGLLAKSHNLNLPVDLQLQLFDQVILPVLLYGCEIWGFENLKQHRVLSSKVS